MLLCNGDSAQRRRQHTESIRLYGEEKFVQIKSFSFLFVLKQLVLDKQKKKCKRKL